MAVSTTDGGIAAPAARLSRVRAGTRWAPIAEHLLGEIRAGRIPVGGILPSITVICAEHRVARRTASKAVGHLRDVGVVEIRPGAGAWVVAVPADGSAGVALGVLARLDGHEARITALEAEARRRG